MEKIRVVLSEVRIELSRATWPKKGELWGATWVVIIASILLSLVIGAMDVFFSYGISKILR